MAHASRNRRLSSRITGTRRRDVENIVGAVQAAATSGSVIDVFALALDSLLTCATRETGVIRLTSPCLDAGAIQITESRPLTWCQYWYQAASITGKGFAGQASAASIEQECSSVARKDLFLQSPARGPFKSMHEALPLALARGKGAVGRRAPWDSNGSRASRLIEMPGLGASVLAGGWWNGIVGTGTPKYWGMLAMRRRGKPRGGSAMSRNDNFDRVVESLHRAALDDGVWPATAALIDEACGTASNRLLVGSGHGADGRVFFAAFHRNGKRQHEEEREYLEHYYPCDERVPRLRRLPDSRVVSAKALYTEAELKTSRVYNEWQRAAGSQNGLLTRLDGPRGCRIVWALCDPVKGGEWQPAQLETIQRLLPHLRQFVRVCGVISEADALGSSLGDLLGNPRMGVIQLDLFGRIVEANDLALGLVRQGDGLFDEGGNLHARLPADETRLQRLLARALPALGRQGAGGTMTVGRRSSLTRLAVHVSPVVCRQLDFGMRRVAALVLVVEPGSRLRVDKDLACEALGLTRSQAEVATLLAEGRSVREIARMTGRQENTVYKLLKQAYRKQGVTRQVELARLVQSLAEFPGLHS